MLLQGKDYGSAKQQLKTCLQKSPGPNSCFVMHNLACGQWWHAQELTKTHPDARAISLEFTECLPNFRTAIKLFEGKEGQFDLSEQDQLLSPLTGLSLTNVAEVLFQQGNWAVTSRQDAHKWLLCALEYYKKVNPKEMGRALTLVASVIKQKGNLREATALSQSSLEVLHHVLLT